MKRPSPCPTCAAAGAYEGETVSHCPDHGTTTDGTKMAPDVYGLCVVSGKHDDFAGRVATRKQVAKLIDDAIKAAVDKANNRAADAFHAYHFNDQAFDSMDAADFEEWLRSGADAPGAVR